MGSRRIPSVTRREWTASLTKITTAAAVVSAVPVISAPVAAQVASPPATTKTPPEGAPAPAAAATTPEQKLQKAYGDIRETSERLAKIEVPMDVEPAFSFRP